MTEEPDTTFDGLLPEHANVFFPPAPIIKKPRWVDDGTRDDMSGGNTLYPHCKYFCNPSEQLDALESDYMTREAISIIVNEVRTHRESKNKDTRLEEAVKMLRTLFDHDCLLYSLGGQRGYCSNGCPLYDKTNGSCTPCEFLSHTDFL